MSNKKDDIIEELLEWKHEQETQEAVKKATSGMVMLRCSTVIISIWTMIGAIGMWASDHFRGLEAAIKAFIDVEYRK